MGTITFKTLKQKVIRAVEDTVNEDSASTAGSTYNEDVLKDAVHAALSSIAQRVWSRGILEVEAEKISVQLPVSLIDIDGVYDATLGLFIPKISFQVGQALSSSHGNGWFLYPTGSMTFMNSIGTNGAVIYHTAHWEKPDKDGDIIDAPDFTVNCLVLYASAFLLGASSVSSAAIRQFNTRVDSGQPGDIPQMKMSDYLMRRYEEELKRIPMMEKGRVQ
jgi:hypothetical protein